MGIRRTSLLALVALACASGAWAEAIVADHTTTTLTAIPDSALVPASNLRLMVRRASVGGNISAGLDDLQSQNAKYDRSRWDFQDRGNPGWQAKVDDFVTQATAQASSFDVLTMKFCFIDPDASFVYYRDHLLAVEAAHPTKKIVWWTIPIETSGNANRQAFNDQVRTYARANGKALFDIADIEAYNAAGQKRTDGSGFEIMWPEWTSDGGHLSSPAGQLRVASALWWLMARLAGWSGTDTVVTVGPAVLPTGTASVPYSVTFSQSGGRVPIVWSQTGTLPTGIGFNTSTAVLSGTPSQLGSFPIEVTATDADGFEGSVAVALVVNSASPFVPTALIVNPADNSVFEAGETAAVSPSWRNDTGAPDTVTGAASAFTGPSGGSYTITDDVADYGTVAAGATASCTSLANCYKLSIAVPPSRPVRHWDPIFLETLSNGDAKSWVLHVGETFTDVPRTAAAYRFVETVLHRGVTSGCSASAYCPNSSTSRQQIAVFTLVAKEGAGYSPVACGATPMFTDVPVTSAYCKWVEEMVRRGVTSGCGGGKFCPTTVVTRAQMPIFVLKTLDPTLDPPACTTPMFTDVPASSPFCKWIEELARRGVVGGCGGGNYCPNNPVTRAQMAVFLSTTFALTLYGP